MARDGSTAPTVEVALGGALGEDLDARFADRVRLELARACRTLLEELGVSSDLAVEVTAGTDDGELVVLGVGGARWAIPHEILAAARASVTRRPLSAVAPSALPGWARDARDGAAADWVVTSAREALARRPGALLGLDATRALVRRLRDADPEGWAAPLDELILHRVFATVMDQRVSLRDVGSFRHVLAGPGLSPPDAQEELLALLRPDAIELRMHPEYLRRIALEERDRALVGRARDDLAADLGVALPRVHFVAARDVPQGAFDIRLNDVRGMLTWGLEPGTRLVLAATPDADGLVDPVTGAPYVAPGRPGALPGPELTPLGYVGRCLEAAVRSAARCLVDVGFVRDAVFRLEAAYPALVRQATAQLTWGTLARVVRALVAEGVSVRDLRGVLEAAIDFDAVTVSPELILLDDRLPCPEAPAADTADADDVAAFVRTQLRRTITASARGDRPTLEAVVVAPDLEDEVRAAARAWRSEEGLREDFLRWCARARPDLLADVRRAAQGAVRPLATTREPAPILTVANARAALRRMLADAFPRTRVLAFEELTPDTDIRVAGRLELLAAREVVRAASAVAT